MPEPQTRPAIVCDGVSKAFRLPHEQVHTLKERLLHPLRRIGHDNLEALREVSFTVAQGEFFGIVGRNGSGKSTLLKCMAGIYGVDAGRIYVNGRLSAFIELGVGFNPDLAARDNVVLNAIMIGLSRREAEARYEDVLRFSELERFQDLKLKNYSSGMLVRLAFAVMVQVDADVMLVDEVLAVGDARFQQKCFDEFYRLREEGRTVLLVTHDMTAVHRFCDRALLLEGGRTIEIGPAKEVGDRYIALNFDAEAPASEPEAGPRFGDRSAEVVDAWFEDEHGERHGALRQGQPCAFKARIRFDRDVDAPWMGMSLENDQGHTAFATSTEWDDGPAETYAAGTEVIMTVAFEARFAPGRWFVTPTVAHRGGGLHLIDQRQRMTSIVITGMRQTGGMVHLPHDLRIERVPAAIPEEAAR